MKKKNLIILLVFPFLISVFCIITVNTTYNRIDVDISHIEWNYNDMEGFKLADELHLLEAEGVNQRYYKVSGDSSLVWRVENKNPEDTEPIAEIVQKSGKNYLKVLREGQVIITCSNKKGNVYRQMTGVIYKDAAILLYPKVGSSQTNIDSTIYYGEYDHRVGIPAKIEMTMEIMPPDDAANVVVECSNNIRFNKETGMIEIVEPGSASLTVSLPTTSAAPQTFEFEIVDEGVNVYTYEDLLYCTNNSENGEIAVLRKSFESLDNAYVFDNNGKPIKSGDSYRTKSNNVECFGYYDSSTGKYSFGKLHSFPTTYNREFIDQWNEFAKTDPSFSEISSEVTVGLRVQKDFYGNGYTLNLHNLTYPYTSLPMNTESGEVVRIPTLTADNLFRGPLKLYSLGDPNNVPIVSLYGQDNVGMYVEGDGITINDVNLKNCDFGDRLANLATVGTVMEIAGDNVTVKNCRISNGKNVVRSFSSMNLTLSNCLLSNAQNFLFVTGANEYVKIDESAAKDFASLDGSVRTELISEFLASGAEGDEIIDKFLMEFFNTAEERESMRRSLLSIHKAINDTQNIKGVFKGSATIEDCYFYRSGIASVCMETLFNSSYLQMASPSTISNAFDKAEEEFGGNDKKLIPYVAKGVSGVSYPVKLDIAGDTRFYDYKDINALELDGLLENNMNSITGGLIEIDLDMIFPLRSVIRQKASIQGSLYHDGDTGSNYINIPVAFYGGGVNLSEVTVHNSEGAEHLTGEIEVDLLDTYLNISGTSSSGLNMDTIKGVARKTVISVTGFEPFAFRFAKDKYLYGEAPNVTDLIANAKGE